MERKHYKIFVNYINHINAMIEDTCMFYELNGDVRDSLRQGVIKATKLSLIPELKKDNPRFDENKFYKEIL